MPAIAVAPLPLDRQDFCLQVSRTLARVLVEITQEMLGPGRAPPAGDGSCGGHPPGLLPFPTSRWRRTRNIVSHVDCPQPMLTPVSVSVPSWHVPSASFVR